MKTILIASSMNIACVSQIYGSTVRLIDCGRIDSNLDDRIGNGLGCAIVCNNISHINAETKELFLVTNHVGTCSTCDRGLVTNLGVIVRANGQVDLRETDLIKLMEVRDGAQE